MKMSSVVETAAREILSEQMGAVVAFCPALCSASLASTAGME